MTLTIVETCGRFIVESDKYVPDPKMGPTVQCCLLLTSRGTLARAGDSWATRENAERAIKRFHIMTR